jgi:hypothetical protein
MMLDEEDQPFDDDDVLPIEEGFEMPLVERKPPTVRQRIYLTLLAMEVGQSFVINQTGCFTARKIAEQLKMTLTWKEIESEIVEAETENGEKFQYRSRQFRVWVAKVAKLRNSDRPSWDQVKAKLRPPKKQPYAR